MTKLITKKEYAHILRYFNMCGGFGKNFKEVEDLYISCRSVSGGADGRIGILELNYKGDRPTGDALVEDIGKIYFDESVKFQELEEKILKKWGKAIEKIALENKKIALENKKIKDEVLKKMTNFITVTEENFPDKNFRKYLIENFGKKFDPSEIKKINVRLLKIKSLKGIEFFTNLEQLNCSENELINIEISNNTNLVELICSMNNLTNIDISNNTKLKLLSCGDNNLTNIDISNNTKLKCFYCNGNKLTNINISNNIDLQSLNCSRNKLENLDVIHNTKLEILNCKNNKLININIKIKK